LEFLRIYFHERPWMEPQRLAETWRAFKRKLYDNSRTVSTAETKPGEVLIMQLQPAIDWSLVWGLHHKAWWNLVSMLLGDSRHYTKECEVVLNPIDVHVQTVRSTGGTFFLQLLIKFIFWCFEAFGYLHQLIFGGTRILNFRVKRRFLPTIHILHYLVFWYFIFFSEIDRIILSHPT
jgi:hypothetical protein